MFTLSEPYRQRPIRFLELWQADAWRMKCYGIAYARALPRPEVIETAQELLASRLPELAASALHYHTGFAGVHDGRDGVFIFLDFWANQNELHHHVFVAPVAQPRQVTYVTPTGLSACVWDLAVQCYERQAWIETVLANPNGPDRTAYLARRLDGEH